MEQGTSGLTLERAAVEAAVTILFGLDQHSTQVTACRQRDGRLPQPARKLTEERVLEQVSEHVQRGDRVFTCYEAGPCGYGLHRKLTALGATNYVVAPQRWDERGLRVKTDRRDARELCLRLGRYVEGNIYAFTVVRVPTEVQERRRALCRQRQTLLKERQRCELRGHGLLLNQGHRAGSGWWEPAAWTELAPQLPAWLRDNVGLWQQQAVRFQAQVDALTPRIEALSTGLWAPKGFGPLTTALIEAEILDWSRFTNRRQPGGFTGLCPSEDSTNRRRRQGSVTKHGNPRLRHLLVEALWRMLDWQPDYPPVRRIRAAKTGRARKRVIVAAARQLAVDLWRIRTGRRTSEELHLIMHQL